MVRRDFFLKTIIAESEAGSPTASRRSKPKSISVFGAEGIYERGSVGAFSHMIASKAAATEETPNNYRIDPASNAPSVIARSPCDEAIQEPTMRGPWISGGCQPSLDCFALLANNG